MIRGAKNMNKKGVEISLNFIIIAALALIALIVIALFFLGGAETIFQREKEVVQLSAQTITLAKQSCSFACTMRNREGYNNPSFPEELTERNIRNCEQLYNYLQEPGNHAFEAKCMPQE